MQVDSLPDGWTSAPLASVTRLSKQKWEPSDETEGRDYLSLEHIEAHTGRLLGVGSSDDVRSAKNVYEAGDVLYGKLRPYLNKVARPDEAGVCSTDILVFKPTEALDSGYLEALLRSHAVTAFAMTHAKGINLPRVSSKSLGTFEVPIPPLPEQKRIVARLDAIEAHRRAAKERLDALPERLDQYRQSVLAAAFRGDLTAGWRAQHPDAEPAEALLDRIRAERRRRWIEDKAQKVTGRAEAHGAKPWTEAQRDERLERERAKAEKKYEAPEPGDTSDLPDLPAGWVWARWEEVGFCQNGRAYPSKHYSQSGVRLLRPGNLHKSGSIEWNESNTRHMPAEWATRHPEHVVGGGELIMNLTAQSLKDQFLGRICRTGDEETALLNQRLARITPVEILGEWCLFLFKSPRFRKYVDTLNTGSLIQHMFTSQVDEFVLPLPPADEQIRMISILRQAMSTVESVELTQQSRSTAVDQLRQATLARAFRGDLVPTDAALAHLGATEATHAGRDRGEDRPPLTLFGATSTD